MASHRYQAEYDAYCRERAGYNFSALDYITWLSWHLNVPLPELRSRAAAGEQL